MRPLMRDKIETLLTEKRISKTELSEKLGIGYSTLWRRLSGRRVLDVDFLMDLASLLGTSVSYLIGETDESSTNNNEKIKEKIKVHQSESAPDTSGHLVFKHRDYQVDIPDTPSNKKWFRELIEPILLKGEEEKQQALLTSKKRK